MIVDCVCCHNCWFNSVAFSIINFHFTIRAGGGEKTGT